MLQLQGQGDWSGAAEAVGAARHEFGVYLPLVNQEALSLLAIGDTATSLRTITNYPNLRFGPGEATTWLVALIHLHNGTLPEASAALEQYLDRPIDESRELNEGFLLRLWDQQESVPENHRLCFHFPIMPASLTGLNRDARRVPFSAPVLPALIPSNAAAGTATGEAPALPAPAATPARVSPPKIYVSYAWGEDTTEEGRRREEIVDRLCDAVRASGREIGRDKEWMRAGDSIERFAHEISRAQRIVAVISEKSLHSDYCMAHELFRAYRRCDFQRHEFQEKVIALVMDDAIPLIKDDSALVELTRHWKQRVVKVKEDLAEVDPDHRSHNLWATLGLPPWG